MRSLLRARNSLESGDAASAIGLLQKVSDLDHHPDGVRDLLKAYLQTGRIGEAGPLAVKLFSEHSDAEAMFAYIDGLVQNGGQEEALEVIDQHSDRLLAENSAKVLETLRAVIGPVGSSPAALEKLLELFQKAGDQSHVSEVNELLAHACVQSGDLARARDLYQALAENEPQNAMHMQNYQQVVGMIRAAPAGTKLLSVEEGIILVEELEATAPPVHLQEAVLARSGRGLTCSAYRYRTFYFVQHARQGARPADGSVADRSSGCALESAPGSLVHAFGTLRRRCRLLPHVGHGIF